METGKGDQDSHLTYPNHLPRSHPTFRTNKPLIFIKPFHPLFFLFPITSEPKFKFPSFLWGSYARLWLHFPSSSSAGGGGGGCFGEWFCD